VDTTTEYAVEVRAPRADTILEQGACNACTRFPVEVAAVLIVRDHYTRFCFDCFERLVDSVQSYDFR
jgi:hypothetical protein